MSPQPGLLPPWASLGMYLWHLDVSLTKACREKNSHSTSNKLSIVSLLLLASFWHFSPSACRQSPFSNCLARLAHGATATTKSSHLSSFVRNAELSQIMPQFRHDSTLKSSSPPHTGPNEASLLAQRLYLISRRSLISPSPNGAWKEGRCVSGGHDLAADGE